VDLREGDYQKAFKFLDFVESKANNLSKEKLDELCNSSIFKDNISVIVEFRERAKIIKSENDNLTDKLKSLIELGVRSKHFFSFPKGSGYKILDNFKMIKAIDIAPVDFVKNAKISSEAITGLVDSDDLLLKLKECSIDLSEVTSKDGSKILKSKKKKAIEIYLGAVGVIEKKKLNSTLVVERDCSV